VIEKNQRRSAASAGEKNNCPQITQITAERRSAASAGEKTVLSGLPNYTQTVS